MNSIYIFLGKFADKVAHWAWSKLDYNTPKMVVKSIERNSYTQDVWTNRHHLIADEPIPLGGHNLGATPFELLQASLASCTVITLRMYCEHKDITVDNISVNIRRTKLEKHQNQLDIEIDIQGDVDDNTKKRMLKIAARCPVHQAIKAIPQINLRLI